MSNLHEVVAAHEERLRVAQLASDVEALDELLADELQFVFLDGAVYTKQMDLEAHRARVFRIESLDFSEQAIRCAGDTAVVTVKAKLSGTASGLAVAGVFRYLRIWVQRDGRWQIVAGSVSSVR